MHRIFGIVIVSAIFMPAMVRAQSLGNAGTVEGSVLDPSGAAIPGVQVDLRNPVSGYEQKTATDASGVFRFINVPPNPYHVRAVAVGSTPPSRTSLCAPPFPCR
jgi:protocatechuate 3,4-dioxygenase beta subunit